MPYIVTRFPRDEIVKIEIRSAFERIQKNQYVIINYSKWSHKPINDQLMIFAYLTTKWGLGGAVISVTHLCEHYYIKD